MDIFDLKRKKGKSRNSSQEIILQIKIEKMNITNESFIFELVKLPNFGLN